MHAQTNDNFEIVVLEFRENENIPNNLKLPVLLYKNVFEVNINGASMIENVFATNNWGGSWRNGIYSYHHYHSTAHEALGVYSGWAVVQLGGPNNEPVRIEKGDLVILPAGTGHKKIESGNGFAVVGAYPDGQTWDMNYGEEDVQKIRKNIERVSLPSKDPVAGEGGVMFKYWK